MAWTSFKDAADKSLNRKGITPQIQESLVLEKANWLLIDILGQQEQNKVRAMYWKGNVLTLAVLDDSLFYQLRTIKKQFLEKLNSQFEKTVVEDIKILS
ncbi:DUF721 domain-containing protein [bacterium]|nr:DUF721 domain-containing protein [bacterium]